MAQEPTHIEVKTPQISLENLALLVTVDEGKRRRILIESKYIELGRLNYYQPSTSTAVNFLATGAANKLQLVSKILELKNKVLTESRPFHIERLKNNIIVLNTLGQRFPKIVFPRHTFRQTSTTDIGTLWHGVKVSAKLQVDIEDQKPSSNVLSIGGVIYRYKKNSRKNTTTQCEIQAAFIYERQNELHLLNGGRQPRKRLCTILDVYSGELTKAPGNAKRQFKNLKNGCLNIKDQWDSLPPPRNAVLK